MKRRLITSISLPILLLCAGILMAQTTDRKAEYERKLSADEDSVKVDLIKSSDSDLDWVEIDSRTFDDKTIVTIGDTPETIKNFAIAKDIEIFVINEDAVVVAKDYPVTVITKSGAYVIAADGNMRFVKSANIESGLIGTEKLIDVTNPQDWVGQGNPLPAKPR